ncbi:hypothetical protein PPYR_10186 [Photinus pyralis]|uniref:Uncharacterized protein n=1 Tax=Photinus pyralis TaxID=7054 RepID=A0A5N4AFL9_PHOPY|nr:hypothetical protein PPYR_10186 [Photinus pyralis]
MENKGPSGDAPPSYSAIVAPDTQSFYPQILPYAFGGYPYEDGALSYHLAGAQQVSNAHQVVYVSPLVHQQSTIPALRVTPPHNGPIIQAGHKRSRGSIAIAVALSVGFIIFMLVFITINV